MNIKNPPSDEWLSTYTATLIHDLKTPIQAQISALNLLLKGSFGTINESQQEILEQLKASCEYANNLVLAILDTYLFEQGKTPIEPQYFNFNELVEGAINETVTLAKDKNQTVTSKTTTASQPTFADRFQLKRVIVNLISNAIKYGFSDSDIEIEAQTKKNELVFKIFSFSKYINNKNIKKLYNKFQTDERGKSSVSCGLGLYLVKQIIKAHKGKVFAKSEKSGKCTFGLKKKKKFKSGEGFKCSDLNKISQNKM